MKRHKPMFIALKEWVDELTRYSKKRSSRLNRRLWNRKIRKDIEDNGI